MPSKDNDITPAILLDHMRGMEQRLKVDFRKELQGEIHSFDEKLSNRIDQLDDKLTRKIDVLSVQIGNMDERLDHIEVVEIPKLKKAVGKAKEKR